MAMTDAMEDVVYDYRNFNFDLREGRHPLWVTEKHFVYHLAKDRNGELSCAKTETGEQIRSPRCLSDICIYSLVNSDAKILHKTNNQYWPSNIYPIMLSEAIYQREAQAIEWLVSTWPMKRLGVFEVIPLEDYLDHEYLTLPIEGNEQTCLVDYFIMGLLKLKPEAGLKEIDFTGFEKDRKLCRELCRLPILWMKPSDRTAETVHSYVSGVLDVTKDKVQRFLNRIKLVYSNIDKEFKHGNEIEPLMIHVDLKVTIDDVPLGLTLQKLTPFRFCCQNIWMKHIPDVTLLPSNLHKVVDPKKITHFEFNDAFLAADPGLFSNLLPGLAELTNLTALSIPNSIDVHAREDMVPAMNKVMVELPHLQRLNLSYCNLKGQLEHLLADMRQHMTYLNLKDCRLTEEDMFFLLGWRPLVSLRELNLSCNNLNLLDQVVLMLLERMSRITCFSVTNCQNTVHSLVLIAREVKECSFMKVLCVQGYTPLLIEDTREILDIVAQVRTLQKVVIFPEAYAFPGSNERERKQNKYRMTKLCYQYLFSKGRRDLWLE